MNCESQFSCLLCRKPVPILQQAKVASLCFECWRTLGEPRNLDEAQRFLDEHPALESGLLRRAGFQGENSKS